MFKVTFQPIPALQDPASAYPEVWAWSVSDGMVIIARFGNREAAEEYCDWRIARARGLVPSLLDYRQMRDAMALALIEKQAAEAALQAFVEGRLIVKP